MLGTIIAALAGYFLYSDMRAKMIKIKSDVRVNKMKPQTVFAVNVANEIYRSYGMTLWITSGNEPYAKRASPNYHENGYAFDIALPSRSDGYVLNVFSDDEIATLIKSTLGYEYDVVREVDHIHIEFDYNRANNTNTYGA
jgi:hypothetical protein